MILYNKIFKTTITINNAENHQEQHKFNAKMKSKNTTKKKKIQIQQTKRNIYLYDQIGSQTERALLELKTAWP